MKKKISAHPEKRKEVASSLMPRDKKQEKSSVLYCSYYRRLMKGFFSIAEPPHKLTEKYTKFSLSDVIKLSINLEMFFHLHLFEVFQVKKTSLFSTPTL